jgi:hypothetical protein
VLENKASQPKISTICQSDAHLVEANMQKKSMGPIKTSFGRPESLPERLPEALFGA